VSLVLLDNFLSGVTRIPLGIFLLCSGLFFSYVLSLAHLLLLPHPVGCGH
jgi:hypothetical protein